MKTVVDIDSGMFILLRVNIIIIIIVLRCYFAYLQYLLFYYDFFSITFFSEYCVRLVQLDLPVSEFLLLLSVLIEYINDPLTTSLFF